jgi:hypothetical protein
VVAACTAQTSIPINYIVHDHFGKNFVYVTETEHLTTFSLSIDLVDHELTMESWQITALVLCGFGLFKEFRPSEPFLVEYIVDYKEVPIDDVSKMKMSSITI